MIFIKIMQYYHFSVNFLKCMFIQVIKNCINIKGTFRIIEPNWYWEYFWINVYSVYWIFIHLIVGFSFFSGLSTKPILDLDYDRIFFCATPVQQFRSFEFMFSFHYNMFCKQGKKFFFLIWHNSWTLPWFILILAFNLYEVILLILIYF